MVLLYVTHLLITLKVKKSKGQSQKQSVSLEDVIECIPSMALSYWKKKNRLNGYQLQKGFLHLFYLMNTLNCFILILPGVAEASFRRDWPATRLHCCSGLTWWCFTQWEEFLWAGGKEGRLLVAWSLLPVKFCSFFVSGIIWLCSIVNENKSLLNPEADAHSFCGNK